MAHNVTRGYFALWRQLTLKGQVADSAESPIGLIFQTALAGKACEVEPFLTFQTVPDGKACETGQFFSLLRNHRGSKLSRVNHLRKLFAFPLKIWEHIFLSLLTTV